MPDLETFLGPFWPLYAILRVLIIFADMVLLFVTIFAAVELFHFRPHFVYDPRKPSRKHAGHGPKAHPSVSIRENWEKIKAKTHVGTPEAIRLAIIEADGLVDNVLKKQGYEGDTFADRLSKLNPLEVATLDRAWAAHRLRNDVVHTPGFQVSPAQAEKTMKDYEDFLEDIGAFKTEKENSHHASPGGRGANDDD